MIQQGVNPLAARVRLGLLRLGQFVPEPTQVQATSVDVGQRVPQVRRDQTRVEQGLVLDVRDKAIDTNRKHRGRAGHVEDGARLHHSGTQHAGRLIAAAGRDGRPFQEATVPGGRRGQLSDDVPGLHNAGQLFHRDLEETDEFRVPDSGGRIAERGEVEVGVIDKSLISFQACHAASRVGGRHDKFADLLKNLRALVLPPQDLGSMTISRRPAGFLNDQVLVALHHLNVAIATRIQPRIVGRGGSPVGINRPDTGHLTVKSDGCYVGGVDPAFLNAFFDGAR